MLINLWNQRQDFSGLTPNTLPRPIVREVWQMATQALVNLRRCANV
jgi:hypothetical protein